MAEPEKGKKEQNHQDKQPPCQVTFSVGDKQFNGTCSCFNESGMLVQCSQPAPLNQKVKLTLVFPGIEKPIDIWGDVVWTNVYGPEDIITPRAMGVKFSRDDTDVIRIIADLALQYESPDNIYHCYYT